MFIGLYINKFNVSGDVEVDKLREVLIETLPGSLILLFMKKSRDEDRDGYETVMTTPKIRRCIKE